METDNDRIEELKNLVRSYRTELGVIMEWFKLRQLPGGVTLPEPRLHKDIKAVVFRLDRKRDQLFHPKKETGEKK